MNILPLDQIKEKIKQTSSLSDDEISERIKKKMEELSGLISEEGAAHIIANELGISLLSVNTLSKIGKLAPGMRGVDVVGKVVRRYEVRSFQTQRGSGKVGSFVLGDESGTVRAVLWNDMADKLQSFKEGDVLKISSSYVRENNGYRELHLNDHSSLIINPPGEKVETAEQVAAQRKTIKDLAETDDNVELLVTLVDVFDPRYFTVCPQCGKRALEGAEKVYSCSVHGAVTPQVSYVLNVIGDDGTDTIRIAFWRNQAERLLSQNSADILRYKDYPEQFQDVKHSLLGEMVKVVGRVTKNTMFDRLEFSAQLVFMNPDPKEELQRLES